MEIRPTASASEAQKLDSTPTRTHAQGHTPPSVAAGADDSVSLTDGARQLHDLQAAVAATPIVDSDRLAALGKAIANGSYRIDPQRIADGLLAQDRAALE